MKRKRAESEKRFHALFAKDQLQQDNENEQ